MLVSAPELTPAALEPVTDRVAAAVRARRLRHLSEEHDRVLRRHGRFDARASSGFGRGLVSRRAILDWRFQGGLILGRALGVLHGEGSN